MWSVEGEHYIGMVINLESGRWENNTIEWMIDKRIIGNGIGDEVVQPLCEMLKMNTTLTGINLAGKWEKWKHEKN